MRRDATPWQTADFSRAWQMFCTIRRRSYWKRVSKKRGAYKKGPYPDGALVVDPEGLVVLLETGLGTEDKAGLQESDKQAHPTQQEPTGQPQPPESEDESWPLGTQGSDDPGASDEE